MPVNARSRARMPPDSPSPTEKERVYQQTLKSATVMKTPVANIKKETSNESHRGRGRALEPSDSPGPNTQWERSEHEGLLTYHDGRKWWFHCQSCDYLNDRLYHTKMHYQRIHVQAGKAMTLKRKYPASQSGNLPSAPLVVSSRSPRVKKESGDFSPSKSTPKSQNAKASPGGGGKASIRTPVAARGSQSISSPKRVKLYAGASPVSSPSKAKGEVDALVFTFGTGRIVCDGKTCDALTGLSINAAHLKQRDGGKKSTPRGRSGKTSVRSTPQKRRSKMVVSPTSNIGERPQTPVNVGLGHEDVLSPEKNFPFTPMTYGDGAHFGPDGKLPQEAHSPPIRSSFRLSSQFPQFESPRRLFPDPSYDKPPSVPSSPWLLHGVSKSRETSIDFTAQWKTPTLADQRPIIHRTSLFPTPVRAPSPSPGHPSTGVKRYQSEDPNSFLACMEDLSMVNDYLTYSEEAAAHVEEQG